MCRAWMHSSLYPYTPDDPGNVQTHWHSWPNKGNENPQTVLSMLDDC